MQSHANYTVRQWKWEFNVRGIQNPLHCVGFHEISLLIGTGLEVASNQTIEILTNREIITINQVVGTAVTRFRWQSTLH
ncbi:hypothetical protein EDD15DRAFT_2246424 [Pisolithus albus]|nr:hypothetical protein EDD15DRAFT_2246424 [Pisolithus albus]